MQVTEHGRPVAQLTPLPKGGSALERLISEGKATPATGRIEDLPPLTGPITDEGTRALRDLKKDKI